MLASDLARKLEVLVREHGDGRVHVVDCTAHEDPEVSSVVVEQDEDMFGNLIRRSFILS